jgi:hypothetical protein
MLGKVTIPIPAQAPAHPAVCTTAIQEAAALPILSVVTSVMSPIPFVGSNLLRFLAWRLHPLYEA